MTETSTDGAGLPSAAWSEATVAITVDPVSDTPSVAAATAFVQLNESTRAACVAVVQTSALGIASDPVTVTLHVANGTLSVDGSLDLAATVGTNGTRSEERRVGKEGRSRWSPYH